MPTEEISIPAPFAMPPIPIPVFPNRDFPITNFGAQPDDQAKNTPAIAEAIAACHDAGGGRVVVPAGQWLTGKIHFQSGVNLHLEDGAKLLFSGNPDDYLPAVRTSWEGYECFNYSPLIYAFECENVAITGPGTLEAQMEIWKTWFPRPAPHMDALKNLYTMCAQGVPVEERQMARDENHLRPPFVALQPLPKRFARRFSVAQQSVLGNSSVALRIGGGARPRHFGARPQHRWH